jgi:hypothetical protein
LHEGAKELRFDGRVGVGVEPPLLDVANDTDDTDDFGLHIELLEIDMLPDGIFVWEVGAREDVVYIDHRRGMFAVLRRNQASALESDSHGLLETGLDEIKHSLMFVVVVGKLWLAFDPEGERGIVDHGARPECYRNGLHAGNGKHCRPSSIPGVNSKGARGEGAPA